MTKSRRSRYRRAARDAAARIAWSFRKLFNLPEAMALIRGERPADEHTPYWRQVLDYCAAGNLQAVLDEYVHTLRDLEGLFAAGDEDAWESLAIAVSAALSLRTGVPRVDELRHANGTVGIERRRMRNHFAVRFGTQESDDGRAGAHEGQVRQAFNSPFWPFVLASTSVGQEGLDCHAYCHSIMHWNLPSNPVDLEQREGRVHRYKGHAVRKNVAAKHGAVVLRDGSEDAWRALFEAARKHSSARGGLARISHQAACRRQKALGFQDVDRDVDDRADCGLRWPRPRGSFGPVYTRARARARAPSTVVPAMLSVGERDASVVRTGPKSSAIITAPGEKCGLVPYWLFPLEDGAHIERHVPALPLSRDASQLEALKRSLAVYRMVFGQPRQDDLMAFLLERCSPEVIEEVGLRLRIDLSPGPTERS